MERRCSKIKPCPLLNTPFHLEFGNTSQHWSRLQLLVHGDFKSLPILIIKWIVVDYFHLTILISKATFYHLIYSFTTMSLNMAYGKHRYKRLTCILINQLTALVATPWTCLYRKWTNLQQRSVIMSWINFWRSGQCRYCHLSHWCGRSTANIFHPPSSTTSSYSHQFVWKPLNQNNLKVSRNAFEMGEQLSDLWAGKFSIEVNLKKLVK